MRIRNSESEIRNPNSRRRGISLLEVLMAIFVISVGLLGLAALLPLAQHLANRGATADRAAIAGKSALDQLAIRGAFNTDNWLRANGAAFNIDSTITDPPDAARPMQPVGPKAFCIDPRLLARDASANVFPNTGDQMERITLRQWSGGAAKGGAAMGVIQADEWFTIRDDLNFAVDEANASSPPVQVMDSGEKRFSNDEFTYLATLVREGSGDRYTLSVAVIVGRNAPDKTQEFPVGVSFLGTGIGGGDVSIATANTATMAQVVPGQWIFLAKRDNSDPMNPQARFRWYRIVYAADVDTSVAPAKREVTLAGRDWDTAAPWNTPSGTIIPGVVAVYERTVRLETSSLWER